MIRPRLAGFEVTGYMTNVTIGNGVTNIGPEAFAYCTSLTSITISHRVTSIGSWALIACANLTSVTIPNSVASIGDLRSHTATT